MTGAVAKSYMRKGFLIYEEMRKYLVIFEEAVSPTYLTLQPPRICISLYMRKIFFSFLSVLQTTWQRIIIRIRVDPQAFLGSGNRVSL
jgi:hypothetical protein